MTDLLTRQSGPIMTIVLNRPQKLNALTFDMHAALTEALDRADRDDDVRAVVITGAGRGFCAGTDLSAGGFARLSDPDANAGNLETPPRDRGGIVTLRVFASRKPIIAAVNGVAAGMGAALTLAMDVRIGTPEARYVFPYVRRGIAPESCSSWFLPRLIGVTRALDWMMSGRVIAAEEALEAGLLSEIVPADRLVDRAIELANQYIDGASPVAVSLARRLLWQGLAARDPMQAHLQESQALVVMARTGDPAEGARAFVEKRTPAFRGSVTQHMPVDLPGWELTSE